MRPQKVGQREAVRVPFTTAVEVRFEEFGDFVSEYSENLSLTGMFLRTSQPHPAGSILEFEFRVADGQPLIRGVGEVMWVRLEAGAEDKLPGMGVRFVSIDARGQKMISWLLERSLGTGGPSFEI